MCLHVQVVKVCFKVFEDANVENLRRVPDGKCARAERCALIQAIEIHEDPSVLFSELYFEVRVLERHIWTIIGFKMRLACMSRCSKSNSRHSKIYETALAPHYGFRLETGQPRDSDSPLSDVLFPKRSHMAPTVPGCAFGGFYGEAEELRQNSSHMHAYRFRSESGFSCDRRRT